MNSDNTQGYGDNPIPFTAQMAAAGGLAAQSITGGSIGVAMCGTAFAVPPVAIVAAGDLAVGGLTAALLNQVE